MLLYRQHIISHDSNQFIVDTQFFEYLFGNLEFYGNGECT